MHSGCLRVKQRMNLREQVIKGGACLAFRQGIGLVLGLGGTLLLTRALGPGNFGLYTFASGIVGYLGSLTGLGVNIYLIRRHAGPGRDVYRQAFALMLLAGISGLLLGAAALPLLQKWLHSRAFSAPLGVMLLTLPFTAMASPAMARLERELNYRSVAAAELGGQFIYYGIAVVLAYKGRGVWAPVAGYFTGQVFVFVAACRLARLAPRLSWSKDLAKEMLRYGAGYSASHWVWQLRSLVNPLIVGRYAGPEGVGYVALVVRLVEALGFVKGAAWRLSIAVLGKLQGDYPRLRRAVEKAMLLQVLVLGFLLSGFAAISPWLLPVLFGESWNPVLVLYPFVATGYLLNAVFSLHSSVLYVFCRNWEVAWFHMTHILLFAGGALFFLPRFGLPGYGLAELAALLSYSVIHLYVRKLFRLSCAGAAVWLASFLPLFFVSCLGWPAGIFLSLPLWATLALPGPRKDLLKAVLDVKMRCNSRDSKEG
ncbi:MAG: Lipopolysaccharide biosynthesis protein WzxC [Firmicutes bacterium ADurb.Bin456]|nr:MAG: Lipopolysaccharide biosynthesis protein WzxC [Firmicutes bacterium ADurb.Bin456]